MCRWFQKDRRGFTLVELIVVIAIIAVLVTIAVPAMTGYIDTASQTVCEANRKGLERYWRTASVMELVSTGSELTLTQFMASADAEHQQNIASHRCPSGGVISVGSSGDALDCSIHGAGTGTGGGSGGGSSDGDGSGGDGSGGDTVPGTDIPLGGGLANGWPEPSDFVNQNYTFVVGEVFEHGGSYYVVTGPHTSIELGAQPAGPNGNLNRGILAPINNTKPIRGPGDLDHNGYLSCAQGDLYRDGGSLYVYSAWTNGGAQSVPAPPLAGFWYKIK